MKRGLNNQILKRIKKIKIFFQVGIHLYMNLCPLIRQLVSALVGQSFPSVSGIFRRCLESVRFSIPLPPVWFSLPPCGFLRPPMHFSVPPVHFSVPPSGHLSEPLSVNSLVSQCVSELVLSVGVWNFLHPPRVFLSPPLLVHNPIICPLLLCTFLPFPTPLPQTFSAYFQPLFVRFVRCPLFLRFCSVLFCLSPTVYVFHLSPLKCFFIINYGGVEVGLGCPPTATML